MKNKIYFIILVVFSISINQYFGYKGVFPIDSFVNYDSSYNITNGNHPFIDYWTITGPLVVYFQSLFFLILGVNWFSYVIHASLMNMILTLSTFYFFKKIGLKEFYSFIYSLGVAILAYPVIGVPFVDHHAVIFSIISFFTFSLAILYQKNLFWYLTPILLAFSFFTKQIPSAYIIILFLFIFVLYFLLTKNLNKQNLLYFFLGGLSSILLVLILFFINNIPIKNFLAQYIFYPISIGNDRIENLSFGFNNIIGQFKFIYLSLAPLVIGAFVLFKIKNKKLIEKKDFIIFFLFIGSVIIFIYCQLITMNQIFIFLLIPISAAFSHLYISRYYNKNFLIYFTLAIFIFSTGKYHIRFNENKKFMELINVDFNLALDAKKIDKSLSGLKWITPAYKENPSKEIKLLINTKNFLQKNNTPKIIITDYQFFNSILQNKFSSPNKFYDDRSVPDKKNKYYKDYKKFFISNINKNNIKYIYLIGKNKETFFKDHIDDIKCVISTDLNELLTEFNIKKCQF